MKRLFHYSFLVLLLVANGCSHVKKPHYRPISTQMHAQDWHAQSKSLLHSEREEQVVPEKNTQHIIVFIHGATTFIPSLSAFRHAWQKSSSQKSNESFYQHYQNKIRFGGYRKNQPIGLKGLWKIGDSHLNSKNKKTIHSNETYPLVHLYQTVHGHVHGIDNQELHFYTFGWDGSLSHQCRQRWAHMLYRSLVKLVRKLKQHHPDQDVKLSILGHSHGGNVALNLATFEKRYKEQLSVDHLVLLGTPIQSETRHLVQEPLFKQVCNIYSTGDWVQKMDCISTRDFFSRRTFGSRTRHKPRILPPHIVDLEVRVNDYQPAHAEFWFLGGILHFFYRNNFPLYPYPVLTFVPCILEIINQLNDVSGNLRLTIERHENRYRFSLFDKHTRLPIPMRFHAELPLHPEPHTLAPKGRPAL